MVRIAIDRSGNNNSSRKAIEKLANNHPRRLVRNPEYMGYLYYECKMSTTDIAKSLGLSNTTINTGFKQCGIKLRNKSDSLRGKPRFGSRGPNHRDWKGGLSGWRKLSRGRLNESFTRPIMERDGFKCCWCNDSKQLVVHHHTRSFMDIVNIIRLTIDESNIEEFVTAIIQEHKLDDGITLCKFCHDAYHREFGK